MSRAARARLIVADDHRAVLKAAANLLSQEFDVVSTVSSGQAALDDAIRLAPDLVVLDIGMARFARSLDAAGSHLVLVGRPPLESDVPATTVGYDNESGAYAMALVTG